MSLLTIIFTVIFYLWMGLVVYLLWKGQQNMQRTIGLLTDLATRAHNAADTRAQMHIEMMNKLVAYLEKRDHDTGA